MPDETLRHGGQRLWGAAVRAAVALGVVVAPAGPFTAAAGAAGQPPTTCAHLCPNLPDPCVVTQTVQVVPGSTIDCGSRAVQVTGGDLVVQDGRFVLQARSITVEGRDVSAGCQQGSGKQGFTLKATETITVGSQGRLLANCDVAGGVVTLSAGQAVTIGGPGSQAKGTGANARGGTFSIWSGGTVTIDAELQAFATSGVAPGGRVTISARTIDVEQPITVSGKNHPANGGIALRAAADLEVDGPLNASGVDSGQGGDIDLAAGGTVLVLRPVTARGAGSASSGGTVTIEAEAADVRSGINAAGGTQGGAIGIRTRSGDITIGTAANNAFDLTVDGGNGGPAGEIDLTSEGNDVAVYANLRATDGNGGGEGGSVGLTGVTVVAHSPSRIFADGPAGAGGEIRIEARETMALDGLLHANNGAATFVYRTTPPQVGSGVSGPWSQVQDATLDAPCGDEVRRDGVEQCDDRDLGTTAAGDEHDCQTIGLGFTGGTLACQATCAYDTSGCF